MPAIDLFNLLFEAFLGMPDCGMGGGWGCITCEFTHDFVFSLLLPHIILATFFFVLFKDLGHKGLESLLGIGSYIFIVQMGWYPLFASLTLWWLLITIGLGIYFFVVGKIIPPAKSSAYGKAGEKLGQWFKKKQLENKSDEEIKRMLKEEMKQAYSEGNKKKAEKISQILNNL